MLSTDIHSYFCVHQTLPIRLVITIALPQVSHQNPQVILDVIPKNLEKEASDTHQGSAAEEKEEEEVEEKEKEAMDVDGDDDETTMCTMGDEGEGTPISKEPHPKALSKIEKIAKKLFKGHLLVQKKIPLTLAKLKDERPQANGKGPKDIFSYNPVTLKTTISLPGDTMLVFPEHLSLHLGLKGKVTWVDALDPLKSQTSTSETTHCMCTLITRW